MACFGSDSAAWFRPENPAPIRCCSWRQRARKHWLPLINHEIPIILDPLADPQFGTGVDKVRTTHDPDDFEGGKRHDLAKVVVIDEDAKMTAIAGVYAGMDRLESPKRSCSNWID